MLEGSAVARIANSRGALLVEGTIALGVFCTALFANLELVRRAYFEVLLHHGAFLGVRAAVLEAEPRASVRRFWVKALGESHGERFLKSAELDLIPFSRGVLYRAHLEFPTWLNFSVPGGTKHSFEVTRKCRFFLSR